MHKKTENTEIDIPKDDIECWERYPKHHWVYDLSRLLDAQHIGWSPFEVPMYPQRMVNMKLLSNHEIAREHGFIYTKKLEGNRLITEIYIVKGEIKFIRHIDPNSVHELDLLVGELELRLNAFVILHFQKFTGVITTETYGNEIFKVQLRPHSELGLVINSELVKLIRRIYKKTDITLLGLTDRVLHETLAS